ncbi:hypothetical protein [Streptomyces sp. NPDC052012]|uniref:hypothetical protein n=1 Tax=Streptomyces sp. NPDC052012 TaxID=3155051 RepID=UPI00344D8CDE
MPRTMVQVRNAVPCGACDGGRLSRDWYMEMSGVLVVGSECWRHVIVLKLPPFLRAGAES